MEAAGDEDAREEALELLSTLLLASAKALESFSESVNAATHLFDHESEFREMAREAGSLSSHMRELVTELQSN